MDIQDLTEDSPRSTRSNLGFDWTFNLGHIFIVLSLLLGGAGIYAHDESRISVIETRMDSLDSQNLPPRVSVLETQNQDMKERLTGIRDVLLEIRNELAAKQDKDSPHHH